MGDGSITLQENSAITLEDLLAKRVDLVAKAGGFLLLLLYGLGYITTSLHFARLGMPLANPFRPRVAAAGAIYLILSAPFLWLSWRLFSSLHETPRARQYYAALASTAALFFSMCAGISVVASPLFTLESRSTAKQSFAYISLCVVAGLLSPKSIRQIAPSWRDKHPLLSLSTSAVVLILLVLCCIGTPYFAPDGFGVRRVALWFFGVGTIPWGFLKISRYADQSIQKNWALVAIQLLLFLGVFPVAIYPHIKAEWGGGQNVEATVFFSNNAVILPGRTLKVRLLDENEYGVYYCTDSCDQPVFSSRESISSIVFAKGMVNVPHQR